MRRKIGMKPSKDPKADTLNNSNISQAKQTGPTDKAGILPDTPEKDKGGKVQNGS